MKIYHLFAVSGFAGFKFYSLWHIFRGCIGLAQKSVRRNNCRCICIEPKKTTKPHN